MANPTASGSTQHKGNCKYAALVDCNLQFAGVDQGIDFTGGPGKVYALADGTVTRAVRSGSGWPGSPGGLLVYHMTSGSKNGRYVYTAEDFDIDSSLNVGSQVKAGQPIGTANGSGAAPGIECGFADPDGTASAHAPSSGPTAFGHEFDAFVQGLPSASGNAGPSSGGSGGSSIASAFSTFINLPSIFSSAEALAFTGRRSFMADQPLFPFIEQLCQASLRNFMSMPNGNFFAFFPDYFGFFGRKYYWEIHDIEIMHGRIDLSDDPLVTDVAVAGDVTQYHGTIDVFDLLLTSGIFTILDAITTGYIDTTGKHTALLNPTPLTRGTTKPNAKPTKAQKKAQLADKTSALAFLQKYGARPYVEQAPMIRNPFFEMFLAFQKFMLLWSKQFQTPFEFTFMPEVFPGGLVAFPEHNLQCYVEEVVHSFDYEQGFTTTANLSSPSALPGRDPNVSDGMARPAALKGTPAPTPKPSTSKKKKKK